MSIRSFARAATNAVMDPRFRFMYRQRRVEDIGERAERADRIAWKRGGTNADNVEFATELRTDGIQMFEDLIPVEHVEEMRNYFTGRDAQDPYRPQLGRYSAPDDLPAETHVAYFDHRSVVEAPHALEIANHPSVLKAVEGFLGCKPTIAYKMAWWSLPAGGTPEEAEYFHRDYDDYRFCKFFLYLTDVDEKSGPHAFIRNSANKRALVQRRRYTDHEVADAFENMDDHLMLCGKAGTAFLENTFGLHRGFPPLERPRLIFQVLYTLHPYYGAPSKPIVNAAKSNLDPYINRVYCQFGNRRP